MSGRDTCRPIGDVIDGLGITMDLHSSDLVAGAVVVAKLVDADGGVRLATSWSDGMSWLEKAGMLRVAERCASTPVDAVDD